MRKFAKHFADAKFELGMEYEKISYSIVRLEALKRKIESSSPANSLVASYQDKKISAINNSLELLTEVKQKIEGFILMFSETEKQAMEVSSKVEYYYSKTGRKD